MENISLDARTLHNETRTHLPESIYENSFTMWREFIYENSFTRTIYATETELVNIIRLQIFLRDEFTPHELDLPLKGWIHLPRVEFTS